jgi:Zn-dependent peptidase ImmA (M78 family)
MPDIRAAILEASLEADRLHQAIGLSPDASEKSRIDVFDIFVKQDIPLMFRPLKGLLGAFLNDPSPGAMVTTQRQLAVQRFTAAHELGHAIMGHTPSFDDEEIIARLAVAPRARADIQEVQANAFASRLLMPKWLIARHARQQNWNAEDLRQPATVYQLSLRLGTSYGATAYALNQHKVINDSTYSALAEVQPRSIKQQLVAPHKPKNWYGDVWVISDKDDGIVLEGSRTDHIVLRLPEHSASGYLWRIDDLVNAGLVVVNDTRVANPNADVIGGMSFRTIIAETVDGANGLVHLQETRPWQKTGAVELDLELSGPVEVGLLPAQREALLSAA